MSAATLDRAQNAVTYRICGCESAMERTNFYDAVYSPAVLLLNAAVVGAVMLLSASGRAEILALFGMSVGTSVTVINYISRIFAPIESLGMEIQTIQSAMAGVRRINAFLSQPERAVPPEGGKPARGDVVLSHVTFGYGERPVLHNFSMTVRQGEQVHGDAPQQLPVCQHCHVRHVHRDRYALLLPSRRFQRGTQRQRLRVDRVLTDIHLGKGKQPVHQRLHVPLLGVDGLQIPLPGSLVLCHALQQSLRVGADGGQRAFQVMGHPGHQLLLLLLRRRKAVKAK